MNQRLKEHSAMENTIQIRAHHLLCAICASAGCKETPAGEEIIRDIIKSVKSDPFITIRITADIDIVRAHYEEIHSPNALVEQSDIAQRRYDYPNRMKDLELLRRLGIRPNTEYPAVELLRLLFKKVHSLEGICFHKSTPNKDWPECPHSQKDLFKQVHDDGLDDYFSLDRCNRSGEQLAGKGPYSLLPIRTRAEMVEAKEKSVKRIANADRLYIRPHHLLCMLCSYGAGALNAPLEVDNLQELMVRMEENPEIPVTLTEGCCMVCDPCPAYYPEKHICLWMYTKDQLKDLRVLHKLNLKPGSTLKARDLINRLFAHIDSPCEICGADAMNSSSSTWESCCSANSGGYEKIKKGHFFHDQADVEQPG